MRVAVVMAVYNGERHLAAALESLRSQTLRPVEVVVVDDGSTDGTARIAENLGVRVIQQANAGASVARRNGRLALTQPADYVVFLDHDDLLRPTMLERLASHLDAHPEAAMAYARFDLLQQGQIDQVAYDYAPRRFARRGLIISDVPDHEPRTSVASLMTFVPAIPSCSMLRLSVYDATPGWSAAFVGGEETDLFLHMAALGEVHYVADSLVAWRSHSTQTSTDKQRLETEQRAVLNKWRPIVGRRTLADVDLRQVTEAARLTKHHVRAGRWASARESLSDLVKHATGGARSQITGR